jgi:RNA polymerase sigma-70 factor (ECF subfamily)
MLSAVSGQQPDSLHVSAGARLAHVLDTELDFVWRLLRRLGVAVGRVDDESQRVFLILASKLDQIPIGLERPFLVGTAMRVAANARRSQSSLREDPFDESVAAMASPVPSQEELLDHKRRRELLDRILDELSTEQRTVFVLSELEHMSREEIARHLGWPSGTVASRLRLARQHFFRLVARANARLRGGQERSER